MLNKRRSYKTYKNLCNLNNYYTNRVNLLSIKKKIL